VCYQTSKNEEAYLVHKSMRVAGVAEEDDEVEKEGKGEGEEER